VYWGRRCIDLHAAWSSVEKGLIVLNLGRLCPLRANRFFSEISESGTHEDASDDWLLPFPASSVNCSIYIHPISVLLSKEQNNQHTNKE
jgi:hypothetical protein